MLKNVVNAHAKVQGAARAVPTGPMRSVALVALLLAPSIAGCLDAGDGESDAAPPLAGGSDAGAPAPEPPATPANASSGNRGGASTPPRSPTGPWWEFTDTEGARRSRDTAAGSPAVLFFMATWCSTCRSKTSLLAAAHEDYAPRGVNFFSVSFDATDDDGSLDAWKERYRQPWPHGVDPGLSMQRTFGVRSQSTMIVLDAAGDVAAKWDYPGATDAELRGAIDRALAGA